MLIEELHYRISHILLEAMRHLVCEGVIEGIKLDKSSQLWFCNSCEYVKATQKPIRKIHEMPHALEFGEEIDSDLWGPSPVQMPGKKAYYVLLTDNNTQ